MKRRAFTLVELLVVISIISVLMAIALPSLNMAKQQAKSVVCKSNIKQIGLANILYATANSDYYVAAAPDMLDAYGGMHRWHGTRESQDEEYDPTEGPLAAYLGDGEVKKCPARVEFVKGEDWSSNYEQGAGGYGYNMNYIGSKLWAPYSGMSGWAKAYAATTRTFQVSRPSETIMFTDTAQAKLDESGTAFLIETSFVYQPFTKTGIRLSPTMHFRHKGRANIAWVDGHVSDLSMMPVEGDNAYGVNSVELNLGWPDPESNKLFDLQ